MVSDIDDTLKASFSDSLKKSVVFAPAIENALKGMPELFELMQTIKDVKFFYLSAAPEFAMYDLHKTFLKAHDFPKGKLKLKSIFAETVEFKIKALKKIIKKNKDLKNLVLIGDNGQKDALVYDFIAQKYSQKLNVIQYIRQTYAPDVKKALKPFQVPFVSPLEICIGLEQENLMACPEEFLKKNIENIRNEKTSKPFGKYYFHPYMNCTGYEWPHTYINSALLKKIGKVLEKKCF